MTDEIVYEGFLSRGQYACLVVVTAISAFMSILGSVAVTRIAYLKMTSTYQRFLFMLSFADILNSVFLCFHQLVLPSTKNNQDDDVFYWAFGSSATCSMAGFFLHFGSLSVAIYCSILSLYFYFSIQGTSSSSKRPKQPEDIIGCWEWIGHLVAFLLPVGIAITAAATKNIDVAEGLGLCVIQSFDCYDSNTGDRIIDGSTECVETGNAGWLIPKDTNALRWTYFAFIITTAVVSIVATAIVYWTVRQKLLGQSDEEGIPQEMKQRLEAVATQAILYTAVFINSLLWPLLALSISSSDESKAPPFFLHLMAFFMYPLQGAFNCFIYIRPRYQMLKAMYPEDSIIVVARVSLSKAGDSDEIEDVRERIYGDKYEPPSVDSSEHSLASGLPNEVTFDPASPLSKMSLVSVPADDDDMDPEAHPKKSPAKVLQGVREESEDENEDCEDDDDDDDDIDVDVDDVKSA